MKRLLAVVFAIAMIILFSRTTNARDRGWIQSSQGIFNIYSFNVTDTVRDSVVFYDVDIKAKQKSYKKELQGNWKVVSMRRQQKAELENLGNVNIEFKSDLSFTGKAPCNSIGGIYTLKGTSIKFSSIRVTKMACDNLDQESAFLRLLEETVSAYSVSETKLLLRDGSSNIVFELERSN